MRPTSWQPKYLYTFLLILVVKTMFKTSADVGLNLCTSFFLFIFYLIFIYYTECRLGMKLRVMYYVNFQQQRALNRYFISFSGKTFFQLKTKTKTKRFLKIKVRTRCIFLYNSSSFEMNIAYQNVFYIKSRLSDIFNSSTKKKINEF